ncbi:MAG: rRNA maturation RNase YbeY [Clostridia bacterium]|nr:rRNA maturation RNase YbeY [Clostridia bacterium]
MTEIIDELLTEESKDFLEILERVAEFGAGTILENNKFEVTVTLTDDDTIHEINREHRGVDSATDVLSFPLWNRREGEAPFVNPETDNVMLGDIIISIPHVKAQAEEYGHSERREAAYLCIHGILHLLGYDHMTEEDKKEMRFMEEKLLKEMNLTREDA